MAMLKFSNMGVMVALMRVSLVLSLSVIILLDGCYGEELYPNASDSTVSKTHTGSESAGDTTVTSVAVGSLNSTTKIVDYRGRDVMICPQFSCHGRCQAHSANLTIATCFCDHACLFYGDCCFDAVEKCDLDTTRLRNYGWLTDQRPSCSNVFQNDFVLLIDRCHRDWSSDVARMKCEHQRVDDDDVFTIVPVIHKESNIAFKSIECAMCNFIKTSEVEFWFFNISCPYESNLDTVKHGPVNLENLEAVQRMDCHVRLTPPVDEVTEHVRYCKSTFMSTCESDVSDDNPEAYDATSEDSSVIAACGHYAAYVIVERAPFSRYVAKNTHCALCVENSTVMPNITCPTEDDLHLDLNKIPFGRILPSFSLILDFNGYHWQAATPTTPSVVICDSIFHNLKGVCRDARCTDGFQREGEECLPITVEQPDVQIELIVNYSPQNGVGIFTDLLLEEATDHGVSVENITAEVPKKDYNPDCNGVASWSSQESSIVDFDMSVPQNETTLLAIMFYIDDLIESKELNLINARITNVEHDDTIETRCESMERFSIVFNGSEEVCLMNGDGVCFAPNQVAWEIVWLTQCIEGHVKPTTNKSILGCIKQQSACLLVSVSESEIGSINLTLRHMLNDTSFVYEDNNSYVCVTILRSMLENSNKYMPESQTAEAILTAVLLSVSIVALMFTIITYCIIPRLHSLPGRIVISLSLALLLAQALFLAVEAPVSIPWLCTTLAILEHYLWMSTFTWSNILALDLEITLTKSTKVGANRNKNKAFIKFSVYGWGFSAVFVSVVVVLSFFTSLPIRYGDSSVCWLLYKEALLFGFALPVALAVVGNCCLFSRAIYFVWKVGKLVKKASIVQDQRAKLLLYVKLVCLMGMTWLFGIVGTAFHSPVLMYLFTIFNSLQGVYICVAFVCNKHVMKFYLRSLREKVSSLHLSGSQTSRTTSESKVSSH